MTRGMTCIRGRIGVRYWRHLTRIAALILILGIVGLGLSQPPPLTAYVRPSNDESDLLMQASGVIQVRVTRDTHCNGRRDFGTTDGTPLVGAPVTTVNQDTGAILSAVTDGSGTAIFSDLDTAPSYQVSVDTLGLLPCAGNAKVVNFHASQRLYLFFTVDPTVVIGPSPTVTGTAPPTSTATATATSTATFTPTSTATATATSTATFSPTSTATTTATPTLPVGSPTPAGAAVVYVRVKEDRLCNGAREFGSTDGRGIPGILITVTHSATGATLSGTTDATGLTIFAGLDDTGTYIIEIEPGAIWPCAGTAKTIDFERGRRQYLDFTLDPWRS